jgi:hypothetical protein
MQILKSVHLVRVVLLYSSALLISCKSGNINTAADVKDSAHSCMENKCSIFSTGNREYINFRCYISLL